MNINKFRIALIVLSIGIVAYSCSTLQILKPYPKNFNCENLNQGESKCSSAINTCSVRGIEYECGSLVFDLGVNAPTTPGAIDSFFQKIEDLWLDSIPELGGLVIPVDNSTMSVPRLPRGSYKKCDCQHNIFVYQSDFLTPIIIEEAAAHAANNGPIIDSGVDLNYIFRIEGHVPKSVQDWLRDKDPCDPLYAPSDEPFLKDTPIIGNKVIPKYSDAEMCCDCAFADQGTGGKSTIAILDTGLDVFLMPNNSVYLNSTPATCLNTNSGWNFVDSTKNTNDDHGHGSIVALSYLFGLERLGFPVSNQRILPVKVMNECGFGTLFDIACGIYFATDREVDVINMSLGAYLDSSYVLSKALDYATGQGVSVACSSGNSGKKLGGSFRRDHYPSCFNKLISNNKERVYEVGGYCANPLLTGCQSVTTKRWTKSNFRKGMFMESGIHFQLVLEDFIQLPLPKFESIDGTSFSTPLFSSALIKESHGPGNPNSKDMKNKSTSIIQSRYISYFMNNVNCKY